MGIMLGFWGRLRTKVEDVHGGGAGRSRQQALVNWEGGGGCGVLENGVQGRQGGLENGVEGGCNLEWLKWATHGEVHGNEGWGEPGWRSRWHSRGGLGQTDSGGGCPGW